MPTHSKFNFNFFYNNLSELGFIIYPGSITNKKTFRIGCIGNINFKHIKMLLKAIKKILLKMQIKHL
jgi:2-aminoethylphosphonate-pyruvate transaminase